VKFNGRSAWAEWLGVLLKLEASMKKLLVETAHRAARYVTGIANRPVVPLPADVARLEALGGPLPQSPSDPSEVLALLDDIGSPATVATTGGRYFGFVIGGSLPAALAANWLAGAWDQNAAMQVMSPVAAKLEEILLEWMVDLLGLPSGSGRDLLLARRWQTSQLWPRRGLRC
jgi:Pyridoxal-dependent decarboxylase conserved domain